MPTPSLLSRLGSIDAPIPGGCEACIGADDDDDDDDDDDVDADADDDDADADDADDDDDDDVGLSSALRLAIIRS